jgi:4,5-dihydroxyphthalate decarboxylase
MHVICLRRELAEQNPWLAMNLLKSFEQAKRNSLGRLADEGMSYYAVPWLTAQVRAVSSAFGEDFWPYGVAPNRATLDAFTRYAVEQGVSHGPLDAPDLFDAGARELSSSYGRL